MKEIELEHRNNKKKLALEVLLPIVGGSITGWLANRNVQEKYRHLEKPAFSPPPATFPIVWTTLYGMMGYANYRVKRKLENASRANAHILAPYEIQLGLNYIWSFLFFKWGLRGTALMEMTLLLAAITLTAYEFFQVDTAAGALFVPYIAWVSFALALNYSIWKLN